MLSSYYLFALDKKIAPLNKQFNGNKITNLKVTFDGRYRSVVCWLHNIIITQMLTLHSSVKKRTKFNCSKFLSPSFYQVYTHCCDVKMYDQPRLLTCITIFASQHIDGKIYNAFTYNVLWLRLKTSHKKKFKQKL